MSDLAVFAYDTPNLGDDIQSFAVEQLLGQQLAPVYRDYLRTHKSPVRLIANAWYLVPRRSRRSGKWFSRRPPFPPPPCVRPLYIGVSIGRRAEAWMLSEVGLRHLRRHAPIGCRDQHTLEKLTQRDVSAYFSGCPTLTFENRRHRRTGDVYLVDVDARRQRSGLLRRLTARPAKSQSFSHLIPDKVKRYARRLTHFTHLRDSPSERRQKVAELLEVYSTASLVITTRLHAALPCAALGTPCIFLHEADTRFTGYEFLKTYSKAEIDQVDWSGAHVEVPDVAPLKKQIRERILSWAENGSGKGVRHFQLQSSPGDVAPQGTRLPGED